MKKGKLRYHQNYCKPIDVTLARTLTVKLCFWKVVCDSAKRRWQPQYWPDGRFDWSFKIILTTWYDFLCTTFLFFFSTEFGLIDLSRWFWQHDLTFCAQHFSFSRNLIFQDNFGNMIWLFVHNISLFLFHGILSLCESCEAVARFKWTCIA